MDRFIYANPVSYKKFKEDKNMSKTIATQIAEAAVNTKFENLSEDAVLHAKTLTLDVLASMVGTRNIISSEIAREIAEEMGGGNHCGSPKKGSGSQCSLCKRHSMLWI